MWMGTYPTNPSYVLSTGELLSDYIKKNPQLVKRRNTWLGISAAALIIAIASFAIVTSLHDPKAYSDAGLDRDRAVATRKRNSHFHSMMRTSW